MAQVGVLQEAAAVAQWERVTWEHTADEVQQQLEEVQQQLEEVQQQLEEVQQDGWVCCIHADCWSVQQVEARVAADQQNTQLAQQNTQVPARCLTTLPTLPTPCPLPARCLPVACDELCACVLGLCI